MWASVAMASVQISLQSQALNAIPNWIGQLTVIFNSLDLGVTFLGWVGGKVTALQKS